jgi:hypothetical protein
MEAKAVAEHKVPGPRESVAEEINRHTVIAEARLLVAQLDRYLDLIGEWATEGLDDEDA